MYFFVKYLRKNVQNLLKMVIFKITKKVSKQIEYKNFSRRQIRNNL